MGKLGAIPRAQAITEGGRKGRTVVKLPPKAVKSSPEDWPFIEACASRPFHELLSVSASHKIVCVCGWHDTTWHCELCLHASFVPPLGEGLT